MQYFLIHFYFLEQHGADPQKKTRDGQTPLDLVKDGDTDVADLLRGEILLFFQLCGIWRTRFNVLVFFSFLFFLFFFLHVEGDAALLDAAKKGNLTRVSCKLKCLWIKCDCNNFSKWCLCNITFCRWWSFLHQKTSTVETPKDEIPLPCIWQVSRKFQLNSSLFLNPV